MSSRARLACPSAIQPFSWRAIDDLNGRDDDHLVSLQPACAPPETAAAPPPPALTAAEQESHLAALERDAFMKGYAQGERAGTEAGARRADAMLRRVAHTLDELTELRRVIVASTEQQMVRLALAVARRIVGRELTQDPELVAAMAHVALQRLGEAVPATIKLNPEDYTVVVAQRATPWSSTQVRVVPDPAVVRGGCLVESEVGTVDASPDAQLAELSRALLLESEPARSGGGA
jgi:flagellar assembly protein FliH